MATPQSLLAEWFESGVIATHRIEEALSVSGVRPSAAAWRKFIDQLLLWLGVLALTTAVLFFIAYNWQELGRFARFAMVEVLLLGSAVAYWFLGSATVKGQAVLVAAAVLTGVLLALFGQTYQTGADPWQLFATWAVLILPWVLVGRSVVLWLLWIALLNLAVALYFRVFGGFFGLVFGGVEPLLWVLFALNTLAWVIWQWLAVRGIAPAQTWPIRLLALASGTAVTMLVLLAIFEFDSKAILSWITYLAWLAVLYAVYRRRLPDLFMLAGACLTVIVTVGTLGARTLLDTGGAQFGFLFLTALVIGLGAASAIWLSRVNDEFER